MARRHQQCTQRYSASSTQYSITKQSAERGHEIYEADVKAEDLGRKRLWREWSGHGLNG
jgi:fructose-1,6-bisphosphatase/inositol monophosphatase family enzyme